MQICPKCKKELDDMVSLCPSCGELLFNEPIKVNEVSDEYYQETVEDMIEDESIVTKVVVKGWLGFVNLLNIIKVKMLLVLAFLRRNTGKYIKRFFIVDIPRFFKWIGRKLNLYKLKPYMTYMNMLGVAIVISTMCLLSLCIRQFIYFDKTSEVAQVDNKSSFNTVRKMYDKEAQQQLDIETGKIVYSYEDEEVAGVKCNVFYCVNPDNNLVSDIYIQYPKNIFSTQKMRNYILVNYGVPKSTKLKVAWEYKCEDYRYEFSNDAYKAANEQFHVIYEKNAPSAEDLQGYKDGIKESDEYNSDDSKEDNELKSGSTEKEEKLNKNDKESDSDEKDTDGEKSEEKIDEESRENNSEKIDDKSKDKDE